MHLLVYECNPEKIQLPQTNRMVSRKHGANNLIFSVSHLGQVTDFIFIP